MHVPHHRVQLFKVFILKSIIISLKYLEMNYEYAIPLNPVKRSGWFSNYFLLRDLFNQHKVENLTLGDTSSFPATNMGTVGFALNGVPIFNPYDSKCCDAGTYELTARD